MIPKDAEKAIDLRNMTDEDKERSKELHKKLFKLNTTMPHTDEYMSAIKDIFGERFGEGSYIVAPLSLVCAENMTIGKNVYINSNFLGMCRGGITIDDDVQIAGNVSVLSNNHDPYERQILTCRPVYIKKGAWLGAGSTILPGITVGKFAIVGAGSVVTKDVPDYAVVVGNPARVVKTLDADKFICKELSNLNNIMGSYNFQGGETGYFSVEPYGQGKSLAEIEFIAPDGAEKVALADGKNEGWKLSDGTVVDLKKSLMTRRLGSKIEPVIKMTTGDVKLLPVEYRVIEGSMELEDDWSFLDAL